MNEAEEAVFQETMAEAEVTIGRPLTDDEKMKARELAERHLFIARALESLKPRETNETGRKRRLAERQRAKITITPEVAKRAAWNFQHPREQPLPLNHAQRREHEARARARARAVRRALPHWLIAWGRAVATLARVS